MKKKLLLLGLTLASSMAFAVACGEDKTAEKEEKKTPSLTITNEVFSLEQGDRYAFNAQLLHAQGGISWTSDQEDVLSVTADGNAVAKSKGVATVTVQCGTLSDSVTVSVSDEYRPVLLANEPNGVTIYKGTRYLPSPIVSYKGVAVDEEIAYTYESDDESIVLIEDGKLVAVAEGECTVSVSAEYRFYEISTEFEVEVVAHDYLSIDREEMTLSTLETENGSETGKITATVVLDGETGEVPVVWESLNEEVATVKDGTVTAKSRGETVIKASYQYGEKTLSATCAITVAMPRFNTGLSFDYEISKEIRLPEYEIDDFKAENIKEVWLDKTNVLASDGKIDKNLCVGSPEAKRLTIVTARAEYEVDVTVYNAIVTDKATVDELTERLAKFPATATPETDGYYFDGYIVFAADIQYDGAYDGIANAQDCGKDSVYVNGFKGIIDGRNYTVSNMRFVTDSSAFVATLNGGTIKNLNFVNAYTSGRITAIVAANATDATFENVYAQGEVDTSLALGNNNQSRGLFVAKICNSKVRFKNCVAEISNGFDGAKYSAMYGFAHSYGASEFFTDCAVIGSTDVYGHCDPANYNYETFTVVSEKNGVKLCADYEAYMTTYGFALDENESLSATCTEFGYSYYKKSGEEEKRIVVAPLGHDWAGEESEKTCGRCNAVSKVVSAETDVSTGFDFSAYYTASKVTAILKGFEEIIHENGKISFAKSDASDKAAEYTVTYEDGSMVVVNLTVWSLIIDNETELRSMKNYVWSEMRYKWGDTVPTQAQITANEYDYAYFGYFKLNGNLTLTEAWTSAEAVVGKEVLTGTTYTNRTYYCSPLMGFRGVFDGGNHTISNLTFSGNYTSLFGVIGNATIKSLTLKDVTLSSTKYSTAIFGHYVSGATIENVTLSVKIADGVNAYNLEPSGILFGRLAPLNGSGYYAGIALTNVSIDVTLLGAAPSYVYVIGGFQPANADWMKITCTNVTIKGFNKLISYNSSTDERTEYVGVTLS